MPDSKPPPYPPYPFLLILAAALVLAVAHLPYGYYQLLRLGACGLGAWSALALWIGGRHNQAGLLGVFALLYNPFIPVHFDRDTWAAINAVSVVFVIYAAWLMWRLKKPIA